MSPLFRQKLMPPPGWDGTIPRGRLMAGLDAAIAAGRHVVVVAGHGFGKTTVLAAWAATRPSAWLSLDPGDGDPETFLSYLIAACEQAVPGFVTGARALLGRARERETALATLATLLADLEEQGAAPFVLLLDDYHLASSPSLDELLGSLLKYLPAAVRLVVTTIAEPAVGLASLRAARRVALIGEAELTFDDRELQQLRPELEPRALAALRDGSSGWPAAMGMPPELLDAYMEEHFLQDRPLEVRDALAALSLVDGFTPPFFEAVVGAPLDGGWRERLVGPRLVTRAGDDGLAVPQPLRGLLRRRLVAELPAQARRQLSRRVAEALWQTGQPAAALRFAADAGEAVWAADRLEELAPRWLAEGRLDALASALAALGTESERPTLLLADGELRRRQGNHPLARGRFERAAAAFEAAGDARGRARACLGLAMTAAAAGREDDARASLLEARPDLAADDRLAADVCNVEGGLALMGGSVEEAIGRYEASLAHARRQGDTFAAARAIHNLGVCHTRLGEHARALARYDEALAESVDGTPVVWLTPINRALVLTYMGRAAEARAAAEAALELVRRYQLGREEGYALRTLGFASLRLGDVEAAAASYEAATSLARRMNDALGLALSRNYAAELALEQGDVAAALRFGEEVVAALGGPDGLVRVPECGHVQARALAAAGRGEEAERLFDALIARAQALGHRAILDDLVRARAGEVPPVPLPAEPALPALAIRCFGRMQVWCEGREIGERDWQSAKAKALLAYLVHKPEGATKVELAELLYPGESVTENTMYMTLLRLRKALEPGLEKGAPSRYILRTDGRYLFNRQTHFRLDTQEFESALRRARRTRPADPAALDEALALYTGELLPELDHDWVVASRQHYRDQALAACDERLALGGGPAVELALVHRALEIDPLSEEFNRELILRYVEAEEPHRAVEHFRLCERRFREALDMPPPDDLRALVADL